MAADLCGREVAGLMQCLQGLLSKNPEVQVGWFRDFAKNARKWLVEARLQNDVLSPQEFKRYLQRFRQDETRQVFEAAEQQEYGISSGKGAIDTDRRYRHLVALSTSAAAVILAQQLVGESPAQGSSKGTDDDEPRAALDMLLEAVIETIRNLDRRAREEQLDAPTVDDLWPQWDGAIAHLLAGDSFATGEGGKTRTLLEAVYEPLASQGWPMAAVRDWALSWMGSNGEDRFAATARQQVDLPVACVDYQSNVEFPRLIFEEVDGEAGECYEAPDDLALLGSDLVEAIEQGAKLAKRAVRWRLDLSRCVKLDKLPLSGPSLGGTAAVLGRCLRDQIPVDRGTLVIGQVSDGLTLQPVGREAEKVRAAADQKLEKPSGKKGPQDELIRKAILSKDSAALSTTDVRRAEAAGIKVLRCGTVDEATCAATETVEQLKDWLQSLVDEPLKAVGNLEHRQVRLLTEVYVEPDVIPWEPDANPGQGEVLEQRQRWAEVCEKLPPRCVVIGSPGQGKSSLALMTVRQMAAKALEGLRSDPFDKLVLPLRVPLAAAFESPMDSGRFRESRRVDDHTFGAWLKRPKSEGGLGLPREQEPSRGSGQLREQELPQYLVDEIERRRRRGTGLVLFLDGLDEIEPSTREALWRWVGEQCCPVVVLSRVAGFDQPRDGVTVFQLPEFAPWQTRRLVRNWFADQDAQLAILQLLDNPALEAMATNPYLLSLLCLVSELGVQTVSSRWELYDQFLQRLLSEQFEIGVKCLKALPALGFAMVSSSPYAPAVYQWTMVRWAIGCGLDEHLSWLKSQRILFPVGNDQWIFGHRSLADYLAARELERSMDQLAERLPGEFAVKWSETLAFLAEMADDPVPLLDWYQRQVEDHPSLEVVVHAARAVALAKPELLPPETVEFWRKALCREIEDRGRLRKILETVDRHVLHDVLGCVTLLGQTTDDAAGRLGLLDFPTLALWGGSDLVITARTSLAQADDLSPEHEVYNLDMLGCAWYRLGRLTEARGAFQDGHDLDGRFEDFPGNLGRIDLAEGKLARALNLFDTAYRLEGNLLWLARQGEVHQQDGDFQAAKQAYHTFLDWPNPLRWYGEYWNRLGDMALVQDRPAEAEGWCQKALDWASGEQNELGTIFSQLSLARIYCHGRRLLEAELALQAALQVPSAWIDYRAQLWRAVVNLALDNPPIAAHCRDMALDLMEDHLYNAPRRFDLWYHRGLAHLLAPGGSEDDMARAAYAKALEICDAAGARQFARLDLDIAMDLVGWTDAARAIAARLEQGR